MAQLAEKHSFNILYLLFPHHPSFTLLLIPPSFYILILPSTFLLIPPSSSILIPPSSFLLYTHPYFLLYTHLSFLLYTHPSFLLYAHLSFLLNTHLSFLLYTNPSYLSPSLLSIPPPNPLNSILPSMYHVLFLYPCIPKHSTSYLLFPNLKFYPNTTNYVNRPAFNKALKYFLTRKKQTIYLSHSQVSHELRVKIQLKV